MYMTSVASRRSASMASLCLTWLIVNVLIVLVSGQNRPPSFVSGGDMDGVVIPEGTRTDSPVYTLQARDPDGDVLTYGVISDLVEVRDPSSGEVYLQFVPDHESQDRYETVVWVDDGEDRVEEGIEIEIGDLNDEVPVFNQEAYSGSVSERYRGRHSILDIGATDQDLTGAELSVTCQPVFEGGEEVSCSLFNQYFELRTTQYSHTHYLGEVRVVGSLNAEVVNVVDITLELTDGEHTVTAPVTITIESEQDSPPAFTSLLTGRIEENSPVGTTVLRVQAEDSDATDKRDIRYELETDAGGLFAIDARSGDVYTATEIDKEDPDLPADGIVTILVAAQEVLEDGSLGRDPTTVATAEVEIVIQDQNDHSPVFTPDEYAVSIPENIYQHTPIPGLTLSVTDQDQGSNAVYELRVLDYADIFEVAPTTGRGSVEAVLRIKNTDTIDYDEGIQVYNVRVQARESLSGDSRAGEALVSISLTDVNDNRPQFSQDVYNLTISESAPALTYLTTITATDKDSGIYGVEGIGYKLTGPNADHFKIDVRSGRIIVRDRPGPCHDAGDCLDFETITEYRLGIVARDNQKEGLIGRAELIIRVENVNDNPPVFPPHAYVSFIYEGSTQLAPELIIRATDLDRDTVTYQIVGGNSAGYWQIDTNTGRLQATVPIYNTMTPGNSGRFTLTVEASDGLHRTTITVTITVLLTLDNPPIFTQNGIYEQSILEDSRPGTVVETVQADDADPSDTPEGQVIYSIVSGGQGQFNIDPQTGVITVSTGANFNFETQSVYVMRIIAEDQGDEPLSATATVTVNIIDSNNQDPVFVPSTQRVNVPEDTNPGQIVIVMTATDVDTDARLVYSITEPITAYTSTGAPIHPRDVDFQDMFLIDRQTGAVTVNSELDYDVVAQLRLTILATDISASDVQTGTALLIINIVDVNEEGPEFAPPWTPSSPYIPITVKEEQPVGSFVYTIVATDPDRGSIITYDIISDPGGYFDIDPATGAVSIQSVIDYEQVQSTTFVVTATDNGRPAITSTATVSVTIENINDNYPAFDERGAYSFTIFEHPEEGSRVGEIIITDLDLGIYGETVLRIEDRYADWFIYDPDTNTLRVGPGADFDRETHPGGHTVAMEACDSPREPESEQCTSMFMRIYLRDINDNPPLIDDDIVVTVTDALPPGGVVVTITGEDLDIGRNGEIYYEIVGPDPQYFEIDRDSGVVTLIDRFPSNGPDRYTVTVRSCDKGDEQICNDQSFTVVVRPAGNQPPVWVYPSRNNNTIPVPEEQYEDYRVVDPGVVARDPDTGSSVGLTYYFLVPDGSGGSVTSSTVDGFRIGEHNGQISTTTTFDRETQDNYPAVLVVVDSGNPRLSSTVTVTFTVTDVNDHPPTFDTDADCCPLPYEFAIESSAAGGALVGEVEATDDDVGENAIIEYSMSTVDLPFTINPTTGVITTTRRLTNRDVRVYVFTVRADNVVEATAQGQSACQCQGGGDPDTVTVRIDVRPGGSNVLFEQSEYDACVSNDAPRGKSVTTVRVYEQYQQSVTFTFTSVDTFLPSGGTRQTADLDLFLIHQRNGTVTTNTDDMGVYDKHRIEYTVQAAESTQSLTSTSRLRIFVTDPAYELRLTVNRTLEETKETIEDIKESLSNISKNGIVCVNDIIAIGGPGGGGTGGGRTEIVFHLIDGDTLRPLGIPGTIIGAMPARFAGVEVVRWDDFTTDPVLACVIALIALLILALLLLCCICCCLGRYKKRRGEAYAANTLLATGVGVKKSGGFDEQELNMNMYPEDVYNGGAFTIHGTTTGGMTLANGTNYSAAENTQILTGPIPGEESADVTIVAPLEGSSTAGLRIEAPLQGAAAAAAAMHSASASQSYMMHAQAANSSMMESASMSLPHGGSGAGVMGAVSGGSVPATPLHASPTRMATVGMGASLEVADNMEYDIIHGPSFDPPVAVGMHGGSTAGLNKSQSLHNIHDYGVMNPGYTSQGSVAPGGSVGGGIVVSAAGGPAYPIDGGRGFGAGEMRSYASAGDLVGAGGAGTHAGQMQSSSYMETRQFHSYSEYPY